VLKYLYYRDYHVIGRENIPKKGHPLFVISNHQNGLMDALNVLFMFNDQRQPVFIARGDLFKQDVVAKILRFFKILPSFRKGDGTFSDIRGNLSIFDLASQVLQNGHTLVMFPEATHQEGHYLGDFKKGFPRVAFSSEFRVTHHRLELQILPVSIHYEDYDAFRSRVVISVGQPFGLTPLRETYRQDPQKAYKQLNQLAKDRIKEMTLDEGSTYFREYDTLRQLSLPRRIYPLTRNKLNLYAEKIADMQFVAALHNLRERHPSRFMTMMHEARLYQKGLRVSRLQNNHINQNITTKYLILQGLVLLLLLPIFLFSAIHNMLPYEIPGIINRYVSDKQMHASLSFALSTVLTFPITYFFIFLFCWNTTHHLLYALGYLIPVFLSLFFYHYYKKRMIRWLLSWHYKTLNEQQNRLLFRLKDIKTGLQGTLKE
jgi:1-acyl-sn-glycerol-3-phosphate acyltransferase